MAEYESEISQLGQVLHVWENNLAEMIATHQDKPNF